MDEIALKESDLDKLKEYPLENVICSESNIFYYKKDFDTSNLLFKKLFLTNKKRVRRKIETIKKIRDSELSEYKELILPEEVVVIGGIKSGFTIREVENTTNLHIFLKDKNISNIRKINVLKKKGELLERVHKQKQEFYIVDVQDYNFLVDENDDIYVVDLDSSAVSRKTPLESKYISIDSKTRDIKKYKTNKLGRTYPNLNVDNYCYNTMVLNYLAGSPLHRLEYCDYFEYINYLKNIGIIPEQMLEIYINLYSDKYNEPVTEYLDLIPESINRGSIQVYRALQKTKKTFY